MQYVEVVWEASPLKSNCKLAVLRVIPCYQQKQQIIAQYCLRFIESDLTWTTVSSLQFAVRTISR